MADIETSFAGPTEELWEAARAIGEPFAQGTHTEGDWELFIRVWDRVEAFSRADLEGALASAATQGYVETVTEGGPQAVDLQHEAAQAFFGVNEIAVNGIVGHLARDETPEVQDGVVDEFGLQIDTVLAKLAKLEPAVKGSDDSYEQAEFLLQVAQAELAARRMGTILRRVSGLDGYMQFMYDPTAKDAIADEKPQIVQE